MSIVTETFHYFSVLNDRYNHFVFLCAFASWRDKTDSRKVAKTPGRTNFDYQAVDH